MSIVKSMDIYRTRFVQEGQFDLDNCLKEAAQRLFFEGYA